MRAVTFLWVSVVPASPASGLEGLVRDGDPSHRIRAGEFEGYICVFEL